MSPLFTAIEMMSPVVFTLDTGCECGPQSEHAPYRHLSEGKSAVQLMAELRLGWSICFAMLPFWIALLLPADLRMLLVFRMVRFLKLARYSPAMRSMLDALSRERRALFRSFVILIGSRWSPPR